MSCPWTSLRGLHFALHLPLAPVVVLRREKGAALRGTPAKASLQRRGGSLADSDWAASACLLQARAGPGWLLSVCRHTVACLAAVGASTLRRLPPGAAPQLPAPPALRNLLFPIPQGARPPAPAGRGRSAGRRQAFFYRFLKRLLY